MKRNIVRRMLANLAFAVMLMALLPTAYGQNCSLARAAGKYAFNDSGTVIGIGPSAADAILTLDAAGNNGKLEWRRHPHETFWNVYGESRLYRYGQFQRVRPVGELNYHSNGGFLMGRQHERNPLHLHIRHTG